MNPIVKTVSLIALVVAILPSVLFFAGAISHDLMKWISLVGTIVWFVATPMWMGRNEKIGDMEVDI